MALFCSTVIPTIARPELERAVISVLEQDFEREDFEVIVVNDSGKALPPADWQASSRAQVVNTSNRERVVARNVGAAVSRGRYLHFLDDDDWLLPGAFQSLWELSQKTSAPLIFGGSQLVDRQGKPLIQLHHGLNGNCFVQMMSGEWIPLQSALIESQTFFKIGGFTPLMEAGEDVDLCRRIALYGDLAETQELVAYVGMGMANSSSHYDKLAYYSLWGREKILSEPGVFSRLRASANTDAFYGSITRIYLASVAYNLGHRKIFTAISRGFFGTANLFGSGKYLLSSNYWKAITHPYLSDAFRRGEQETVLSN